jgi:cytochrome c oxidase subunit II
MSPRMSVLDPAGPQASRIASLWDVFLYVSIVVWVLVVAFVIASAIVSRRNTIDDPLAEQPGRDRRSLRVIIVAAAATVFTLVGLLVVSVLTGSALASLEDDADALHVRITGKQWWWQIEYERDDPAKVASTANELHVPVGRLVHLELTASDVIHSFWVPSVHGKRDLIPGRINRTWIRVDQPGIYRGQCAEFCGLEHANMIITIVAEPVDRFEQWWLHQRQGAPTPLTPAQERGRQVFQGGPCALCHSIAGTSAGGRVGPDLTHVAGRLTLGAGALTNTHDHLRQWVEDAQRVKPGARMPRVDLPPADLEAVIAYLETLQ